MGEMTEELRDIAQQGWHLALLRAATRLLNEHNRRHEMGLPPAGSRYLSWRAGELHALREAAAMLEAMAKEPMA